MTVFNLALSSSHITCSTPRSTTLCRPMLWKLLIGVSLLAYLCRFFSTREAHDSIRQCIWVTESTILAIIRRDFLSQAAWGTSTVYWASARRKMSLKWSPMTTTTIIAVMKMTRVLPRIRREDVPICATTDLPTASDVPGTILLCTASRKKARTLLIFFWPPCRLRNWKNRPVCFVKGD